MSLNNPTASGISCITGTYTGNNSANRAIPHGLTGAPKIVIICRTAPSLGTDIWFIFAPIAKILWILGVANTDLAVTAPDSTNFYVGNATAYDSSANANATEYRWYALG